ncbi:adenine-specific methyltransferase EcoRI family protein [Dietzia cinnamea]|uniref:adenine-specific methyltransferase EcoRI family protein n=1 Tax=Dietzia cinnamea TaxID=321318 RepID=UPI000848CA64|nr:adenine-specific methyltransferase EcoRI family protein [Dietzia cinnamea]MCT2061244.1 adenine-specific methyltransferase EcoRI family protein [Dietzia cinnamea]MCT2235164.1 adenine-specific methyltransferase EcoRI family protein [Dietzia cinnamea]ODQ84138.1 DNA methyltransferase [Dietzia alimentaria]
MTTTEPVAGNGSLAAARSAQNNEYYTRWVDIEREMNAYLDYDPDVFRDKTILLPCDDPEWSNFAKFFALNFGPFGLKRLIATSYAPDSNPGLVTYQPTLFEMEDPQFDEVKTRQRGKKFVLDRDVNGDGVVNIDDLQWEYLEGDGDYRSDEVTALRDESDIIITNPPFSLGREFIRWVLAADKKFSIIGPNSFPTTKEIFPLIQAGRMWLGQGFAGGNAYFRVPEDNRGGWADGVYDPVTGLVKFRNVTWFTNLEHGQRHAPMQLMTQADNLRYNKQLVKKGGYRHYDNIDAMDVPLSIAIPSDYDGVMGVPVSYLDHHCPEQFDIVGLTQFSWLKIADKVYPKQTQVNKNGTEQQVTKLNDGAAIEVKTPPENKTYYKVDDKMYVKTFPRVLIQRKVEA